MAYAKIRGFREFHEVVIFIIYCSPYTGGSLMLTL